MPYKDPEKQRAANRASYARRVASDPTYSRRQSAQTYARNPEAARARSARWRILHPPTEEDRAARRAYNDQYRAQNREVLLAKKRIQGAAAYAANPLKSQAATKRWADAHPAKGAERQARRRARQRQSAICESVDRLVVAERDGWICQLCFQPIDPTLTYRDPITGKCNSGYLHIDHIYPLSKGGDHSYVNSQASHAQCNKRKAAKLLSVD